MKCMSCKTGDMVESYTSYFRQSDGCYIIIKNVPCYKCTQCGEVYYKASVLEKIDAIIDGITGVESEIYMMDYNKAA